MKRILVLLALSILTSTLSAQVKFRKVIGNDGYDIGMSAVQTFDKGYIIGGVSSSFNGGNTDMYAVKTSETGTPLFHKSFGGINIERGMCIRQTADSGFVFAGYTNSSGAGGYDMYVVKTDSLLNTQWEKTYGGADWDFAYCVEQTADGGYIIGGTTYSFGEGNLDYYLVRTNSLGDTLWTRSYGTAADDESSSVIQTSDGNFLITGTTEGFGATDGDMYTIKTDTNGDTLWTARFGGAYMDVGADVLETLSGEYIVAGESYSFGAGSSDGIIVRYNSAGAYISDLTMGDTGYDNVRSICQGPDGKLAVLGRTENYGAVNGELYLYIMYSNGVFYYATTYGTLETEVGYSVESTADSCFIICGTTNGFGNGLDDIYLIKTDQMGLSGATGSEDTFVTSVNEAAQEKGMKVFPNPAAGEISILTNNPGQLTVCDHSGRIVAQHAVSGENRIDINGLASGIYFLRFNDGTGIAVQKLVITNGIK